MSREQYKKEMMKHDAVKKVEQVIPITDPARLLGPGIVLTEPTLSEIPPVETTVE